MNYSLFLIIFAFIVALFTDDVLMAIWAIKLLLLWLVILFLILVVVGLKEKEPSRIKMFFRLVGFVVFALLFTMSLVSPFFIR